MGAKLRKHQQDMTRFGAQRRLFLDSIIAHHSSFELTLSSILFQAPLLHTMALAGKHVLGEAMAIASPHKYIKMRRNQQVASTCTAVESFSGLGT